VTVQCEPHEDPELSAAPTDVDVRPGTLGTDDLQQLRRVLHGLVTTERRNVTVDLSEVDDIRRTNVVAVLVHAAREARGTGSIIRVYDAPADQRRALFVAGLEEIFTVDDPAYEVLVGTPARSRDHLAV
jgi:anti-anti-sigma regulatory factor